MIDEGAILLDGGARWAWATVIGMGLGVLFMLFMAFVALASAWARRELRRLWIAGVVAGRPGFVG